MAYEMKSRPTGEDYIKVRKAHIAACGAACEGLIDELCGGSDAAISSSNRSGLRSGVMAKRSHEEMTVADGTNFEAGSFISRALDSTLNPLAALFPSLQSSGQIGENRDSWTLNDVNSKISSAAISESVFVLVAAQDEWTLWSQLAPTTTLSIDDAPFAVWNQTIFMPAVAQAMPPMGIPTFVETLKRQGSVALTRKAIAASISLDALHTTRGKWQFFHALAQMASAMVAQTQIAAAAVIANGDEYLRRKIAVNQYRKRTANQDSDDLAATLGCLQLPTITALKELHTMLSRRYADASNQSDATYLLLTEETWANLISTNAAIVKYSNMGLSGPVTLRRLRTLGLNTDFNFPCYMLGAFNLGGGFRYQALNKYVEFGERYAMMFDPTANAALPDGSAGKYKSLHRAIQVYTQEQGWHTFTLEDAIENCVVWDADGRPKYGGDRIWGGHAFCSRGSNTCARTFGDMIGWQDIKVKLASVGVPPADIDATRSESATRESSKDGTIAAMPLTKASRTIAAMSLTKASLLELAVANTPIPLDFYVTMPHIRYLADDAVMIGANTVRRFIRPNLVTSSNLGTRAHQLIGEYESAAFTPTPEQIVTARAVRLTDYIGGLGSQPIDPEEGYAPANWEYRGDYFAIVQLPGAELPRNVNLAGTVDPSKSLGAVYADETTLDRGRSVNSYPGFAYYNYVFGFDNKARVGAGSMDRESMEMYGGMAYSCPPNCFVRPGVYRVFNRFTSLWDIISWGHPFLKRGMVYSGCSEARLGATYDANFNESRLTTI